jgi:YfiH family protein
MKPAWLEPDWPAPLGVRALSTWRGGGASVAPFASLNLGEHVGDSAATVALNRANLIAAAGLPAEPVWLRQVHGADVADLDAGVPTGAADAALTREAGRVCAILTADCLPVLFATETGTAVAAAHAGWRGLVAGVLEATVTALDAAPQSLLAWIGPGIGPGHYEIGAEVRDELMRGDVTADAAFVENSRGRYMADLALLARRRLQKLGIVHIYGGSECTYADAERYFSHRRDGRTGRQATLIWLAAD